MCWCAVKKLLTHSHTVEEVNQLPLGVVQHVQNTSGVVWVIMSVMQNDHSRERLVQLAAKRWFWPRQHILVECANLRDIRDEYFTMSSVTDLFKTIDNLAVINFTKETYFITNCNVCYFNFYSTRNARIASGVLAIAIPSVRPSVGPSVRLSVRPSHAGIVSKRWHVARCSLHRWIAKCV